MNHPTPRLLRESVAVGGLGHTTVIPRTDYRFHGSTLGVPPPPSVIPLLTRIVVVGRKRDPDATDFSDRDASVSAVPELIRPILPAGDLRNVEACFKNPQNAAALCDDVGANAGRPCPLGNGNCKKCRASMSAQCKKGCASTDSNCRSNCEMLAAFQCLGVFGNKPVGFP